MKWNEMTAIQRILTVIGILCAFAYILLAILDFSRTLAVHRAVLHALMGTFWLCAGTTQRNNKAALWYFLLGVCWFVLCIVDCF